MPKTVVNSSLIQIKLAIEILHTCSNSAHDSSKKSRKHLEEQKLKEEINSAAKRKHQLHRLNRRSTTGSSGGHRIHRHVVIGLIWQCRRNQSENPYCTGSTDDSKTCIGLFNVLSSRNSFLGGQEHLFSTGLTDAVIGTSTSVSSRESVLRNQNIFLHRFNRSMIRVCIGAMTQACTVSKLQRLLFGLSVTGLTDAPPSV